MFFFKLPSFSLKIVVPETKISTPAFIAILEAVPVLIPNSEVESILHIPLVSFLNTISEDNLPEHRSIKEMYTFTFEKHNVWGASARMLNQINVILSEENLL